MELVPSLGVLTSTAIFLSPWQPVHDALKTRALRNHNVIPYAMMLNNALVWIIYSLLLRNNYIFSTNLLGWLLSLYYFVQMFSLAMHLGQHSDIQWMLRLLLSGQGLIMLGSYAAFIATDNSQPLLQQNILGTTAIILLILFYSSPLTTLYHVIKSKDASSFNYPFSLTCLINALLWTIYGLSIQDIFVYGPNAIGIIVSAVQILSKLIYADRSLPLPHEPLLPQ